MLGTRIIQKYLKNPRSATRAPLFAKLSASIIPICDFAGVVAWKHPLSCTNYQPSRKAVCTDKYKGSINSLNSTGQMKLGLNHSCRLWCRMSATSAAHKNSFPAHSQQVHWKGVFMGCWMWGVQFICSFHSFTPC